MGPVINYILSQYPKNHRFIGAEIGVAQANNANEWCRSINLEKLVLVDNCSDEKTFGNCTEKQCLDSVSTILKDYPFTSFHKMDSVEASKLYQDGFFDFVYLDGDHTYNGVMSDLIAWKNKVKVGGYLLGHDYDINDNVKAGFDYVNDGETFEKYPSLTVFHVKPAVQNFCRNIGVVPIEFHEGEFAIRRTW